MKINRRTFFSTIGASIAGVASALSGPTRPAPEAIDAANAEPVYGDIYRISGMSEAILNGKIVNQYRVFDEKVLHLFLYGTPISVPGRMHIIEVGHAYINQAGQKVIANWWLDGSGCEAIGAMDGFSLGGYSFEEVRYISAYYHSLT